MTGTITAANVQYMKFPSGGRIRASGRPERFIFDAPALIPPLSLRDCLGAVVFFDVENTYAGLRAVHVKLARTEAETI
jgi:hypothetical protein